MAKQIRDNFIQQAMQKSLADAGIGNPAALDKMMSTTTIEKILSDAPAVYNYFKLANLGLDSLINPKDYREVAFAMPTPDYYREYFDNQNPQPVPFFNFIPIADIWNPQSLGKNCSLKPEQIEGWSMIIQGSGNTQGGATWGEYEGQGAPVGGTGKNMGTGAPAYSGGAPAYGGGGSKTLSTGGGYSPQTKDLDAPATAPGFGGPPPGMPPGGAPPGGGLPPNWDPSAGTQRARDYVDNYLANDPSYSGFQAVFGRSDMTNGIIAGLMEEQMREDSVKQRILTELQTLDARTPEGARRISMLNYEMSEINQTRSMRQDKMMTVKRYHDEFMSVFKNLVDIQNRTVENIGRNMRQ